MKQSVAISIVAAIATLNVFVGEMKYTSVDSLRNTIFVFPHYRTKTGALYISISLIFNLIIFLLVAVYKLFITCLLIFISLPLHISARYGIIHP